MRQVSLRLPEDMVATIDAARGQVPRERWMRGALEAALGSTEGVASQRSAAPSTSAWPRTPHVPRVEALLQGITPNGSAGRWRRRWGTRE